MPIAFLQWQDEAPFPKTVLRGTKARGRAYENKVGKFLAREAEGLGAIIHDHQWLEFGGMWIQPDFVLEFSGGGAILLEAKLTYTRDAFSQLSRYAEVLEPYYSSLIPALVCRNLTYETPEPIRRFCDLTPWGTWHLFL